MRFYKFYLILLLILLLSGCNNNQEIEGLKTKYDEISNELNQLKSINYKLEQDLKAAESEILRLESENDGIYSQLELDVIGAKDNYIWYKIKEVDQIYQTITIVGYNIKGLNEDFSEITISGTGKGELFKVKVVGSIYDFELVEFDYQDENNPNKTRVLTHFDEVRNQNIIINTTLPEGFPGEKIRWKDIEGNKYEYLMGYDGYGLDGTIIWNH